MGKWLLQTIALTVMNLRSLPQRKGSVGASIFGIAGVVAVFVAVLSIGRGFEHVMTASGSQSTALVMRAGADSEMTSILSREDIEIVQQGPGIVRGDGGPVASAELFVIVNLPKRSTGTDANVPLRGVQPPAMDIRRGFEIVEGRMFNWGTAEAIAGTGASKQFEGLGVGSQLELGEQTWTITGIFESNGGVAESEIWGDVAAVQPAYKRQGSYQSVYARLESAETFQAFKDELTTDPRLNVQVKTERAYFSEQSELLTKIVSVLGTIVAGLMGVGAVFGALNTMYAAVEGRTREIATMRALGYHRSPVVASVILESLVLALIGGVIGAGVAYLAFDGYQTATLNWQSFSQVAFEFQIDIWLLLQGIFYAAILGVAGGLLPGIRAARQQIAHALRQGA